MAKIKHTKNELKFQREALTRFERFLPMLQLKKQQLQVEIQAIEAKIEKTKQLEKEIHGQLQRWVKIFSDPFPLEDLISFEKAITESGNIAGVHIPILREVIIRKVTPDFFTSPPWVDDAVETLDRLMRLRVEREIFNEQKKRVEDELRTTSQRVNLFEKVKIPECRENLRIIKIFLGDEQTAAVARGKMAKKRMAVA